MSTAGTPITDVPGDESKSAAQLAYEAHVAEIPTYRDGSPRKTWSALPQWAKWQWSMKLTGQTP